jgi:hypothetical protein
MTRYRMELDENLGSERYRLINDETARRWASHHTTARVPYVAIIIGREEAFAILEKLNRAEPKE